jgi:hypothetical protein
MARAQTRTSEANAGRPSGWGGSRPRHRPAQLRLSAFGRLWLGETVSVFGSQVTFLALPLAAVVILGATPAQMGLLGAVDNLPYLMLGLAWACWSTESPAAGSW